MSWASAIKYKTPAAAIMAFTRPPIPQHVVDWARLVSLDLETYWDQDYTLSKLSTSEYVRDPRFKAQMLGIKIGNGKTRIIPAARIRAELAKINWSTHAVLCHNTQFDGFILSHHYGVHPVYLYDTLSMARGLHSNDIGAGLDEVSIYYGGQGKTEGLEATKGVLNWGKELFAKTSIYCANDVDEMFRVFKEMLPKMPADEMDLIDLTCRMFCSPVLKVDIPRVEKELERELTRREVLMYEAVKPADWEDAKLLKGKEKLLEGKDRDMLIIKRVIGSNEKFAELLRAEGVEPPLKISPAWMKRSKEEREDETDKYAYAFAKDDAKFIELPHKVEDWGFDLNDPEDVKLMVAKQERLQALVDVRIAVKSTTNITRAQRFLTAGANGMSLPVGYAYYRAHTGRWGGQNKMNMQNLTRGGELRLSILAPKGHKIAVQDSGQIECRVNGWLWGQTDLMDAFRAADAGTGRDAYCNFGDHVYGREITKADKMERFVGKVCLGPETRVLTNRGIKTIVSVKTSDLLWDGTSWVKHDGLLDQGSRETLTHRGLCATPDHEILTGRGWLAWSEVLTDPSRFRSALNLATLLSSNGSTIPRPMGSLGGIVPSVDARAAQKPWSTPVASSLGEPHDATRVPRSPQAPSATGSIKTPWQTTRTEHDCSTGSLLRLQDALIQTMDRTFTMGSEASQYVPSGRLTARRFFGTCRRYLAGMSPSWRWTEPTQTLVMSQGTFASSPSQGTSRTSDASKTLSSASAISRQTTQTYDLANAGPNSRFTVLTDDGPVIVHNCVLGLGFQMGAPKFQLTLAKGALGGPPVYFEADRCKMIVNTYRQKNDKIVAGWGICKQIIEDMASGKPGSHGPINWEKETIWLPNGMALKYPDLRKSKNADNGWDEWSYQAKDQRKKIYGGLLCENIVQALARIIVAWQMLQISRKYRVVMTTHDEVVAMPKAAQAEACLKYMAKWMSTAPAWCSDIPLNCEGGYDVNYSK